MSSSEKPFFVGYLAVPKPLVPILLTVAFGAIAAFCVLAFAVGATQDDPGDGRFRFDFGQQTVTGVMELQPYPMLHVTSGTERIAPGETLLMSGAGKFGVAEKAGPLAGQGAKVTGIILNRGTIQMLQVPNMNRDIVPAESTADVPDPVDLGKWRLSGEICDGKCVSGAMRPGRGLAHKACAELCLVGGVPPVFVTTEPVEGFEFLLIGSADGGPLPEALQAKVGVYISLEGRIETRGSMAVFLAEESTLEVLP